MAAARTWSDRSGSVRTRPRWLIRSPSGIGAAGPGGGRHLEVAGELVGHRPPEEGPEEHAGVLAVLSVPGVDVGLAAAGEGQVPSGEPPQEGRGGLDLLSGVAVAGRGERLPASAGREAAGGYPRWRTGGWAVPGPRR